MASPLKALSSAAMLMLLLAAALPDFGASHDQQNGRQHRGRPNQLGKGGKHNKNNKPWRAYNHKRQGLKKKPVLPQPQPQQVVPGLLHTLVPSLPVLPNLFPEIKPGVPIAKPTHPDLSSADTEAYRHDFKPGQWKQAHATFYTGDSGSFGGACGYADVHRKGYGEATAALSTTLFNNGHACGACFEMKCIDNPKWCKPGQPSLFITATNFCPPNFREDTNNGGWCNPPRDHFDIAYPAFKHIAEYKVGIVPVTYRRVPCKKPGGIKFTITGHKHFTLVSLWNVGGAGDITHVDVKGDNKLNWTPLFRNWGAKWQTRCSLEDESLTFKVTTSDGRSIISPSVTPNKYWTYGQTFEGLNFR